MEKSKPIRLTGNFVEATTDKNEMLDVFNEETKHTPGKWEVVKTIHTNIKSGDAYIAGIHNRDKRVEGKHISDVNAFDETETIANANLIASAPEMLEMLKECKDVLDIYKDNFTVKIEELINKAEGK